ncbi:MAG: FliI/YscN family ATPase [Chthoniobacterales bacterium]|nr:FliI/YscN family ATPase [Chthoniobacterales bacterium]
MSLSAPIATPTLDVQSVLPILTERIRSTPTLVRYGEVAQVTGLVIEANGPRVSLGDLCIITAASGATIHAEVVGFRGQRVLLMPLGDMHQIHPGCPVVATNSRAEFRAGLGLIGRILDGIGRPIDGKGPLETSTTQPLHRQPPNPLLRRRISQPFETGIKALDTFVPFGRGQRVGLFAGSGVGKSTLLGMIARGAESDVNVLALVGERGRELREFIEKDLGPDGMARSVVVVATSDQPALVRLRSALLATSIAEFFRDLGKNVLFLMDSVTRFAMAQREIGLAVGEPPASRGYTPSVFSLLPKLMERTGNSDTGSITAIYTVLVDGDDMNEPIADAVRGILDGHVVLSRALATANHYPAIDVLESVSRLINEVCTPAEVQLAAKARDLLATYRKNEDLISIGAYIPGQNPNLDLAVKKYPALSEFLRQPIEEKVPRSRSYQLLAQILQS